MLGEIDPEARNMAEAYYDCMCKAVGADSLDQASMLKARIVINSVVSFEFSGDPPDLTDKGSFVQQMVPLYQAVGAEAFKQGMLDIFKQMGQPPPEYVPPSELPDPGAD